MTKGIASGRGPLLALVLVFVLTRAAGLYMADHPGDYAPRETSPSGDTTLYARWAAAVVDDGLSAYGDVRIEYPPGSLPFIVAPELGRDEDDSYKTRFLMLMLLLDVAGLVGIMRLSKRWGSLWGPWLWVALLPLLGPICWSRLDLIPAVATIWAVERAAAGGWLATGAWMGFGAIAKVYPAFLLPTVFAVACRRREVAIGALVTLTLPIVPYLGSLGRLFDSVVGYHSDRGIQVESLWGSGMFLALERGRYVLLTSDFGAFHFTGGTPNILKVISLVFSLAALGVGSYIASRGPRGDARWMAACMFATLAAIVSVGSVFSPQFLIWLFALGAAVLCVPHSPIRLPVLLLLVIAPLTQLIYPYLYTNLLAAEKLPIFLLCVRNVLMLAVGALALWELHGKSDRGEDVELQTKPVSGPSIREPASGGRP